jgi:hypothetical protein
MTPRMCRQARRGSSIATREITTSGTTKKKVPSASPQRKATAAPGIPTSRLTHEDCRLGVPACPMAVTVGSAKDCGFVCVILAHFGEHTTCQEKKIFCCRTREPLSAHHLPGLHWTNWASTSCPAAYCCMSVASLCVQRSRFAERSRDSVTHTDFRRSVASTASGLLIEAVFRISMFIPFAEESRSLDGRTVGNYRLPLLGRKVGLQETVPLPSLLNDGLPVRSVLSLSRLRH